MATETVRDFCTLNQYQHQRRVFYVSFILIFVFWNQLTGSVNVIVLTLLENYGLISGDFYDNAWIAAFTEPIFSKLIPAALLYFIGVPAVIFVVLAVTITMLTLLYSPSLTPFQFIALGFGVPFLFTTIFTLEVYDQDFICLELGDERWILAPLGGLLFGVVELYHRNILGPEGGGLKSAEVLFWEMQTFHVNQLAPVFLHIFEGTIVIGAFLTIVSSKNRRGCHFLLGALIVAWVVHTIWNTALLEYDPFWDWFYRVFSEVIP